MKQWLPCLPRARRRGPEAMKKRTQQGRRQTPGAGKATGSEILREIFARTRSPEFRNYIERLLVELCRVDTTPQADMAKLGATEAACFKILERELAGLEFEGMQMERRPINPAIAMHPSYSLLHFTKTAKKPAGLTPKEAYANRSNLVCRLPGANARKSGKSVALNAHIDVVRPYFPPRVKNGTVYGRGACDDKGPVVSFVAALRVLAEVMRKAGWQWNREVLAMFVVEEETGGNGSLSLALDRELKRHYDSILVGECTNLKFHPANRGAVWYRAALKALPGVSLLEMFAFVNEELEKEGRAIRAESRHALFPQRPVQTCHGILGPFGEHPSRICGEVEFRILFSRHPSAPLTSLVEDCLADGLDSYLGLYGDKTKVLDPSTGKPVVARHYQVRGDVRGFSVQVFGATGHMGAIRERDGAITKTAHLLRSLIFSKAKLEAAGGTVRFELAGAGSQRSGAEKALILEGGQGFVPTHQLEEVTERLRRAAERGAEAYLRRIGRREAGAQVVQVAYEKLHNVAFDGDPDSATVRTAIEASKQCGIWQNEPVLGWTVSCDARLFATQYPGLEVLTFGPGQLVHAHSDQEQIELDDIRRAAEFVAIFLLRQTGTAP